MTLPLHLIASYALTILIVSICSASESSIQFQRNGEFPWRVEIIPGFPLRGGVRLYSSSVMDGDHWMTYVMQGRSDRRVHTSADLKGRVDLRTADDALAFVRLFTSRQTCWLGGLRRRAAGWFRAIELPTGSVGKAQIIEAALAGRIGLRPMTIRRTPRGWTIQRDLLIITDHAHPEKLGRIYRSNETVSREGDFRHEVGEFYSGRADLVHLIPPRPTVDSLVGVSK
jgi:hypothetical protein